MDFSLSVKCFFHPLFLPSLTARLLLFVAWNNYSTFSENLHVVFLLCRRNDILVSMYHFKAPRAVYKLYNWLFAKQGFTNIIELCKPYHYCFFLSALFLHNAPDNIVQFSWSYIVCLLNSLFHAIKASKCSRQNRSTLLVIHSLFVKQSVSCRRSR